MECTLISSGLLPNQSGLYHAKNPWETHIYKHQIEFTETPKFYKHIEWELEGEVPLDIIITPTGVLEGTILLLENQEPTKNDILPKEPIKVDGSNWRATGRYRGDTYTFTFRVIRKYHTWKVLEINQESQPAPTVTLEQLEVLYKDTTIDQYKDLLNSQPNLDAFTFEIETATTEVSIMVIRNNNIDTRIFLERYLETEYDIIGNTKVYRAIYKDGKKYTYQNLEEFKRLGE